MTKILNFSFPQRMTRTLATVGAVTLCALWPAVGHSAPVRTPIDRVILAENEFPFSTDAWNFHRRQGSTLESEVDKGRQNLDMIAINPSNCAIPNDNDTVNFVKRVLHNAVGVALIHQDVYRGIVVAITPDSRDIEEHYQHYILDRINNCHHATVQQTRRENGYLINGSGDIFSVAVPTLNGVIKSYGYHVTGKVHSDHRNQHNGSTIEEYSGAGTGYAVLVRNIWIVVAEGGEGGSTQELLPVLRAQVAKVLRQP